MLTERSILIVTNPTSGGGRALRTAKYVAQRLEQERIKVTVAETSGRGDAEQITREAVEDSGGAPSCVVACGGDGTIQEVANALAPAKERLGKACPVLGLAPAGRCNDFARVLGIEPNEDAIARTLLFGTSQPVDLGRANGRYFCTVATVGVDADISSFVDTMRMPLKGTLAYLYGALRVLKNYKGRELRLTGDFGTIDGPVFVASAANTSSYGGAIKIVPDACPTDGELDLCIIQQVSRLRMLTLLPKVVMGRHAREPEVEFHRTSRFRLETSEPVDVWADGERMTTTPVDIDIAPGAVSIVLPERK